MALSSAQTSQSSLRCGTWINLLQPLIPSQKQLRLSSKGRSYRDYCENLLDISKSNSIRDDAGIVRTTHPVLSLFDSVHYHTGIHAWLIDISTLKFCRPLPHIPLYVGQRPVYVIHGSLEQYGMMGDSVGPREINPSALLIPTQITQIRRTFPYACGVRVQRCGFVDVLFKTRAVLKKQRSQPVPERIGGLFFAFIVVTYSSSSSRASSPARPNILPSTLETSPYIGVPIAIEENEYIPTLLHDEPRISSAERSSRRTLFDLFRSRLESKARVIQHPLTPVGVKGYLKGLDFGTISRTCDRLPQTLDRYAKPFPAFAHDLSLIEATEGRPRTMVLPPWHPDTFVDPEGTFHADPAAFLLKHSSVHKWRRGQVVNEAAFISGVDYLFEGDHIHRSLLWRTESGRSLRNRQVRVCPMFEQPKGHSVPKF
ncbi:hypothetical protein DFH06DRAFT_589342 [Mycena polygramma]|nr:hypothetical protein DFH06DRAFT_589342 [Mycena polygramma]